MSVTTYVRDADGRVVEAVTRQEAEWDAEQVTLMLAHLRVKGQPRGPHGIPLSEAADPAADPAREDGPRFVVEGPSVDFAARALAEAQKKYYDKYPNAPRDGHLWGVKRVDPPSVAAE